MKRWFAFRLMVFLISLTINNVHAQKVELIKTTLLAHYPSASGISYYKDKLYVIGDDARHLMVLDTTHQAIDSVLLFPGNTYRIPWDKKPDMESLFIGKRSRKQYLIVLPSFSSPIRNKIGLVPLENIRQTTIKEWQHPDPKLKALGIEETNIEGSTMVGNKILASNRANLSQRNNYLLLIPSKSKGIKKMRGWSKIICTLPGINGVIGISGLEYIKEKDLLLFTASTEATTSANMDGEIGDSYLGLIYNFSKKTKQKSIVPDELINLSQQLQIGHQKLEGLTAEPSFNATFKLHIVADNDDGRSIIYKVLLTLLPVSG